MVEAVLLPLGRAPYDPFSGLLARNGALAEVEATISRLITALLGVALATPAAGQRPERPILRVGVATSIQLDGHINEAAWSAADSIAEFILVEPNEGGRPSDRTVVRLLADRNALFIGVHAYDAEPDRIISQTKDRDAGLGNEDHIRFVLDTFLDGRSGYIFAVNPTGARYDALVADQGEGENSNWDAIWDAAARRTVDGWSAEIRIPIRSLGFREGLKEWGFNIQRRVQRLQETSRWAGARLDYRIMQTVHAGRITELPDFQLGLGVTVRPSINGGVGQESAAAETTGDFDGSVDATKRLGANLLGSLTINTDFAETEVDSRRTNLTRFPLFFPEKRSFFLEGSDIFQFGLGIGQDALPFHSRRIGLLSGRAVPIDGGAKLNGRVGNTNLGAVLVRTDDLKGLAPNTTLGVVRVRQNVLRESTVGMIGTFGDPLGGDAWTAGADAIYQTSRFRGSKNFLIGVWTLAAARDTGATRAAYGFKADYPNDDWDIQLTYKRIAEGFAPALGFVPRSAVQLINSGANYRFRPGGKLVRNWFFELQPSAAFDLDNRWESYRIFFAPINVRLETGDRYEFNANPTGERLVRPFEIADGVVIPPGEYHWLRYRLEGQFAAKRRVSGQVTWWFGGFYEGRLHEIDLTATWRPTRLLTFDLSAERNVGDLPQGNFVQQVIGTRVRFNISPNLNLSSFVQYDDESRSVGSNTRLRWTFNQLGELFIVYNHNLREDLTDRWIRDSNQLITKLQYTFRM